MSTQNPSRFNLSQNKTGLQLRRQLYVTSVNAPHPQISHPEFPPTRNLVTNEIDFKSDPPYFLLGTHGCGPNSRFVSSDFAIHEVSQSAEYSGRLLDVWKVSGVGNGPEYCSGERVS